MGWVYHLQERAGELTLRGFTEVLFTVCLETEDEGTAMEGLNSSKTQGWGIKKPSLAVFIITCKCCFAQCYWKLCRRMCGLRNFRSRIIWPNKPLAHENLPAMSCQLSRS